MTDYLIQFQNILEDYDKLLDLYKLPTTGKGIKLYRIDALKYIDIESLFYVLQELFGSNIPDEMQDYIQRVFFIERMLVEQKGRGIIINLICTQFIDSSTLLKCENWLKENFYIQKEESYPFQKISLSSPPKEKLNNSKNDAGDSSDIKCHFPIKDDWVTNDVEEILKNAQEYELPFVKLKSAQNSLGYKVRGKQMNFKKDNSGERPFVCSFSNCKRAFKRYEHLKRHTKMHTGERPFKCQFPGCDRCFSRSDNLNAHYKTHSSSSKNSFGGFAIFDKTVEKY